MICVSCDNDNNLHVVALRKKKISPKNGKFHWEKNDIFNSFAQNIDCEYTLEPPR